MTSTTGIPKNYQKEKIVMRAFNGIPVPVVVLSWHDRTVAVMGNGGGPATLMSEDVYLADDESIQRLQGAVKAGADIEEAWADVPHAQAPESAG